MWALQKRSRSKKLFFPGILIWVKYEPVERKNWHFSYTWVWNQSAVNCVPSSFWFSVSQINARHNFLARFIGTKDKENQSYSLATEVNLWVTVMTFVCCMLEIVLYFAYNKLVNNVCNFFFIITFIIWFSFIPGLESSLVVLQRPKRIWGKRRKKTKRRNKYRNRTRRSKTERPWGWK